MIYDPRENLDPPDPELERLLAWFTQNRAPIAQEFQAGEVDVTPHRVQFRQLHLVTAVADGSLKSAVEG